MAQFFYDGIAGLQSKIALSASGQKGTMRKLRQSQKYYKDFLATIEKSLAEEYLIKVYKYDPKVTGSQIKADDPRLEPGRHFLVHRGVRKKNGGKIVFFFDSAAGVWRGGSSLFDLLYCCPKLQAERPANERAHEVVAILGNGDFYLGDWVSRYPEAIKMQDECMETNVLGVPCDLVNDMMRYAIPGNKEDHDGKLTKRFPQGRLASLFAPLSWVSPFIVKGNIIMGRQQ
ncbi:unnamed protein product [Sphagnum tenellum]